MTKVRSFGVTFAVGLLVAAASASSVSAVDKNARAGRSGARNADVASVAGTNVAAGHSKRSAGDDKDIEIDGSAQTLTRECRGGNVAINGSNNTIILHGDCRTLVIQASHNKISVDSLLGVYFDGGDNHVTYKKTTKGKPPEVKDLGKENSVRQVIAGG